MITSAPSSAGTEIEPDHMRPAKTTCDRASNLLRTLFRSNSPLMLISCNEATICCTVDPSPSGNKSRSQSTRCPFESGEDRVDRATACHAFVCRVYPRRSTSAKRGYRWGRNCWTTLLGSWLPAKTNAPRATKSQKNGVGRGVGSSRRAQEADGYLCNEHVVQLCYQFVASLFQRSNF